MSWWITHPDQMTLQWIWAGWTICYSQILNQKPQTKAMCSLSCCAWSGLVMHLDQPGARPSNQNHIRGYLTIFGATQLLRLDLDNAEITVR